MNKETLRDIGVVLGLILLALGISYLASLGDDEPVLPEADVQTIAWTEVPDILATGNVEMVMQTHSQDVSLLMESGLRYETVEPEIDAIFELVRECGEVCSDVALATE